MELEWAGPKPSGFYTVVEDCLPSITVGVAVRVGGLDGHEDGGAVVLFGNLSPPLEIALELLGDSDGVRTRYRRGDHVMEFWKVEPRHWNCEVQELRFFLLGM